MRRLIIIGFGGALWLLLAALPVLADGGPHVMDYNNGSTGISADGCASCHRIHTSKSPTGYLLTSADATVTTFCRSCHGASGTGASTDVDTGVQYALGGTDGITRDTGTTVGALRGGGFVEAEIGSSTAYRLVTAGSTNASNSKVPVNAAGPQPVTSAHLALGAIADGGNGLTSKNIVWGSGGLGAGDGSTGAGADLNATTSEMGCTACHNPHGNGNYRILNPIPEAGTTQTKASIPVNVEDATFDPARTRNYTVIQVPGVKPAGTAPTPAEEATWLLYADQVLKARADTFFDPTPSDLTDTINNIPGDYSALSGDYLHKALPYNTTAGTTSTNNYPFDAPNARPNTSFRVTSPTPEGGWSRGDPAGFNMQMTAWCSTCHTRYNAPSGSRSTPSIDNIYKYRHTTAYNRTCTTCHVAHGTNAVMNQVAADGTTYSANVPFPDGSVTAGDSRLLKVDNRGTCQMCHDPTEGSAATNHVPPVATLPQGLPPVYVP